MGLTSKGYQYCSLEEGIEQLEQANKTIKWIAEQTDLFFQDCKKLVKLNQELGLKKFHEHLSISSRLYKLEYLLQMAIVDLLRFEHDNIKW